MAQKQREVSREIETEDDYLECLYEALIRPISLRASYTKLDTYRTCPRKFKYIYMDKLHEPPSEAMLIGSAVHSALETWVAVDGKDVGDLLDIFAASCEDKRLEGSISDEEEELARVMLYDYFEQLQTLDRSLIIGVEHMFELLIPGTRITGVIDRAMYLDDKKETVMIPDYKSGRNSITAAKAKTNWQMGIYTLAAKQLWPAKRYITELIYPRLNKTVSHEFTDEELNKIRSELIDTSTNIKLDSRFAPKGTPPICGYCGYNTICGWGKVQNRIWKGIVAKRERNKKK